MFILALQFWMGDRGQALQLAKLVADLESAPRNDVTFMFSARYDCPHEQPVIDYVKQKFPVVVFTSNRAGSGWPAGPNQLMADTYQWVVENTRNGFIKAEAVLLMEPDCIPLNRNWINLLMDEYRACDKMILGCWHTAGNGGNVHINGNMIMHKDFWKVNRSIFAPPHLGGWDAVMAPTILPHAAPSRLIFSDYRLGEFDNPWIGGCDYLWQPKFHPHKDNPLFNQPLYPVWFHGLKNELGIECVRQKLL